MPEEPLNMKTKTVMVLGVAWTSLQCYKLSKIFPRYFGAYLEYFVVFQSCYLFISGLTAEHRIVFCRTLLGKLLYREVRDVCSEIHTEHIKTLGGQNVKFLNIKPAVRLVV